MRVYNISQIKLSRQMGIEELIGIMKECRSILVNINGSERYLQLIKRIDDQLKNYEISEISSQNYMKIDLKNRLQCPNEQHSSEQSRFSSLSNSSVSKFSPVSIKRIQSSPEAPLSNTNKLGQQEQISVNNSLSQSWIKNTQSQKVRYQQIISKNENTKFEVDDFFVIDYSFDKGEYEILPKKAHFYDNWSEDQYFETTDKKDNNDGCAEGIFPFAMIQQSNMSNNRSSMIQSNDKANRSMIRSSMEVEIGTSNSRLQLISSKQRQQQKLIQYLYETRQVIRNLLISSSVSTHIKPIKLTSSMTDLLKLTTNPSSKNSQLEHLVLPSFLQIRTQENQQQCDRYTHIIKTIEGIKYQDKHYECERFWVIVEKGRKFVDVERVIRKLIKKLFEIRVSKDREVENVQFSNVRKYLEKICLYPKNQFYKLLAHSNLSDSTYYPVHISPLSQLFHYCRSAVNFKFSIEINSEPRSFSLLIILVYFIIYEFKIVFLATKGYEGLMSEIIVAMTHMLGEMRYVYPVVMASMTTHHIEFVNSPVPGVVALWGKDTRYKKAVQYMKRKLMQEEIQNSQYQQSTAVKNGYMSSSLSSQICHLPTLIIDMNKHEFLYHEFSHKQLFLIENLHNYFNSSVQNHNAHDTKESNNLVARMRIFFSEKLLAKGNNNNISDHKWIQMLKERLEKTQMYEEWIKWRSDKVKK